MADLLLSSTTPEDIETTGQALGTVCARSGDADACVRQLGARWPRANAAQKRALLDVLAAVGGKSALSSVRSALGDSDKEVRSATIRTLGSWNSLEVAPDLLQLARAASDPAERQLCLRSYLALAGQPDVKVPERLQMCREAAGLVKTGSEKKMLLGSLGGIQDAEAVKLIAPYLDDGEVKEEASTAVVNIADKLLHAKNAAKVAPEIAGPLEKVTAATANQDLAKRAKDLLETGKAAKE